MTTLSRKHDSVQGLPDTIFAGLSFPNVPTSDILVTQQLKSQINAIPSMPIEDEDIYEDDNKPLINNDNNNNTIHIPVNNKNITCIITSYICKTYWDFYRL